MLWFSHVDTSLRFLKELSILKLNPNHPFSQDRSEQDFKYQDPLPLARDAVYLMLIRIEELAVTL